MAMSLSLDCPQCHQLCLGPCLLPCGHVLCRKCLRHSMSWRQPTVGCPTCQENVPLPSTRTTLTELLLLFPPDVAMEAQVDEEFLSRTTPKCKVCKVPDAVKLCLDCQEAYCPACSYAHEVMEMSFDHKQKELPDFHEDASDSTWLLTVANPSGDSRASSVVSSVPSEDEARVTGLQQQQWEQDELQQWLSFQAEGLQEDISALKAVADEAQDLTKLAQKEGRVLSSYLTHLQSFDVTGEKRNIVDKRLQHIKSAARSSVSTRLVSFRQTTANGLGNPKATTLRLVLLGKTGVGKSTTGNSILRKKSFFSTWLRLQAVTCETSLQTSKRSGRMNEVVDTPGLFDKADDTEHEQHILQEILKSVILCLPGPHTFLLVFRGNDRFSKTEEEICSTITELLSETFLNLCIVVFTHISSQNQMEELISRAPVALHNLLNSCGCRVVGIENQNTFDQQHDDIDRLIPMALDLQDTNGGQSVFFSNELTNRCTQLLQSDKFGFRSVDEIKRAIQTERTRGIDRNLQELLEDPRVRTEAEEARSCSVM